ncbi:MAG: endonuclease MutS2 [Herpetosiphonaceae bacterium]|nr:MAG: endonuclease MutS2 [Herpetosiphonaceae bacterium]
MPFDEHLLETLEYSKVLAHLAHHTSFSASRELALTLRPADDAAVVALNQMRTTAARTLLEERPELSIGGARDIRPLVMRAMRGGTLETSAFLEIQTTLSAMRRLRRELLRHGEWLQPIQELAEQLPELQAIETEIERTIGPEGEVLDSASPALARIRRDVRVAFDRLQTRLQSLLSQYANALQEPIITVRNGRYVVPVRAEQRRALRGIVHDQSGSGATLYIEPLETVDLNNRWRELQLAEQEEIERILRALSERIAVDGHAVIAGVDALAEIDLAFAKAKYSLALRCIEPEIGSEQLELPQARHPMLDQSAVVPIDVQLGGSFRVLIITGPNTGGKTVALKTVGLLALMAQSGLHIPAAAPARLPLFEHIFADIGDEQSIEQSLSTFSSHMTNIISILKRVNRRSLVLLDELGAGTDPVEGAALARAIIERLLEVDCLVMATSHYAELKAFAYNTPGVENASVEFNVETLSPTYRLSIGLPGRSNALAIAARLGLDPAIIERARSTVASDAAQVEDMLAAIHRARAAAEEESRRAAELREDAEKLRNRLQRELYEIEHTKAEQIEQHRSELESELREVRAELRRLRDEFRSVSLSRQWLEAAEQRLAAAEQAVPRQALRPAAPKAAPIQEQRGIRPGDQVFVRSVKLSGEVLDVDEESGEADVQVGGFRLRVDLRELRREKSTAAEHQQPRRERSVSLPSAPAHISMQLDMRGWRAAEVAEQLDRYLNDAYLANLNEVRLIHGKGTGTLRQIVRDILRSHPLVETYSGGGAAGGEGVTVVKLVTR